jgi:hypothetical protein
MKEKRNDNAEREPARQSRRAARHPRANAGAAGGGTRILRGTPEEERARAYWWAHIRCALDDEHEFLGRSMFTMRDTIEALEGEEESVGE